MTKKGFFLLILALCLTLAMPLALSEETAYVPGETMDALIGDAFDAGKIVGGDLRILFDMNTDVLAPGDEEERALIDGITQVLDAATLSLGVGKIDGGYRIELSGTYAPGKAEGTSIAAAVDLTADGLAIESNLIEGERVTARWETVLALCGVPQEQIDMILSLKEIDLDAALTEMVQALEGFLATALQLAEPYLQIVGDFAATLPVSQEDQVAESGAFPAVDHEIAVTMTDADLARLIIALADQLETDENLVPMLDSLLADGSIYAAEESTPITTTAELCDLLRDAADSLADAGTTYTLLLGYCDEAPVCYIVLDQTDADGESNTLAFILTADEAGSSMDLLLTYVQSDADGDTGDNVSLEMSVAVDPADPNAGDVLMSLFAGIDGEETAADYAFSMVPFTTQEDLPGYRGTYTMNMNAQPGNMRSVFDMTMEMALTADGGESFVMTGTMDAYDDSERMSVSYEGGITASPAGEENFTGRYWFSESMKELGLDEIGLDIALYSKDYDPADSQALTSIELESVTIDEMNALNERLSGALEEKLTAIFSALPPQLLSALVE